MSQSRLTDREINNINLTKSAIKGRFYRGSDGVLYQGIVGGLLTIYEQASKVSVKNPINIVETVQEVIDTKTTNNFSQDQISSMIMFRL